MIIRYLDPWGFFSDLTQVACGEHHSLVLTAHGEAWCSW